MNRTRPEAQDSSGQDLSAATSIERTSRPGTGLRASFGSARYANVTATLALMVALSGTAYAAVSVTGKDIRNGTIRGADIANGTITSSKIRNRTIRSSDVAASAISSRNVRDASLEARDFKAGQLPAGIAGPPGPPGTNATASVIVREAQSPAPIAAGDTTAVTALCAAGEKAVAGGAASPSNIFDVRTSAPVGTAVAGGTTPTGWRVEAANVAGAPNTLLVFAICAGP